LRGQGPGVRKDEGRINGEGRKKRMTMAEQEKKVNRPPGVCVPWEEKKKELPGIVGDEEMVKRVWEGNDGLAYVYIWQLLLSF